MMLQVNPALDVEVQTAVDRLAQLVKSHPAYVAFMQAHEVLQACDAAQQLLGQIQTLESRLQFDWSPEGQQELEQMLGRLNELPEVQQYAQAQQDLQQLFQAVDRVISESAGVEFAANARRRGCCGG
ncbi:MAG: hypothetical protein Kow0077_03030 [Anaerolineae bacterium]